MILLAAFVLGYLAIVFEHPLKLNKAAAALLTGVACWTAYIVGGDAHLINEQLGHHLGEIAGILFFLLGAMTVVELIDAHDGFEVITSRITTRSRKKLVFVIGIISFFLSAVLDNLTTAIVMISLIRKLVSDRDDKLYLAGLVVIAANAGGAWSPIGDVTTTMLWIGGQLSAGAIIFKLIVPSLFCLLIPMLWMSARMKGNFTFPEQNLNRTKNQTTSFERNAVFFAGVGVLVFVPVFKTLTHLPPFMGMLLGVGILWVITELIHKSKDNELKGSLTVGGALQRIDTPSVLFFLGILLAIGALQSNGTLTALAQFMNDSIGNINVITVSIGFLSAIVDNVPLVAAAQGMYSLTEFPMDNYFWEFLAYCAGTGGSILIIGSAAGVAVMGMENISFFWYLRKISVPAILGYLGGALVYMIMQV